MNLRKLRPKQKRVFFRPKFIFLFITFIFLMLTTLFFKSEILSIKNVEIKLQNITCSDTDQLKKAADLYGKNIFLVDTKKILKTLKEKFICVKNVNFSKTFPDSVKMEVLGRDPKIQLVLIKEKEASTSSLIEESATPSAEQALDSYIVDDEGIIFAKGEKTENIPRIFLSRQDLSVGAKINGYLMDSLKIMEGFKKLGITPDNTMIIDNYLVTNSNPKIIFKLGSGVETQIASLQLILKMAKIDNESLEFIDLRFDKPVLKFAPKKNG